MLGGLPAFGAPPDTAGPWGPLGVACFCLWPLMSHPARKRTSAAPTAAKIRREAYGGLGLAGAAAAGPLGAGPVASDCPHFRQNCESSVASVPHLVQNTAALFNRGINGRVECVPQTFPLAQAPFHGHLNLGHALISPSGIIILFGYWLRVTLFVSLSFQPQRDTRVSCPKAGVLASSEKANPLTLLAGAEVVSPLRTSAVCCLSPLFSWAARSGSLI